MNVLAILIPASLLLGLAGLAGFLWLLRHDQFDDPAGHATRILSDRYDEVPAEDAPPGRGEHDGRRKALDAPRRVP